MPSEDADYWQRKADAIRVVAAKMSTEKAKAVMLDLAEHYELMARRARTIASLLTFHEDSYH